MIYGYALIRDPNSGEEPSLYQPSLLATNSVIRQEALPIFYAENQFVLYAGITRQSGIYISNNPSKPAYVDDSYKNFKQTLDLFLSQFTGNNGVDKTSRLEYIRELKIHIDYTDRPDLFDVREDMYHSFNLTEIYSFSAYSTWGEREILDTEEFIEQTLPEPNSWSPSSVWKRKEQHNLIGNAHQFIVPAVPMPSLFSDFKFSSASVASTGIHCSQDYEEGDGYGDEALLSVEEHCPLATKSITLRKKMIWDLQDS